MKNVKVRFAPSPTGFLHIGGLRTALFNWLWARKHNGKFILRIEDTDQARYVEGAVDNIKEALAWYGLDFDEEPIFQSKQLSKYEFFLQQLIEAGKAYYCFCSQERLDELRKLQTINKQASKYDGKCRSLTEEEIKKKLSDNEPHVIRLKVPQTGVTEFDDIIYGHISVDNKNIDDQILLKSDGYPTYHLANVIDDYEQKISHVIRAEEWLPSTPKHILLYEAFNWSKPVFAHLPIVLGPDKSKLSKRHGAVAALKYKELGYLPEVILNFIALLGWNPKTEKEIFTREELINEFDLNKVNKSSAVFNITKLDWLNAQYIRNNIENLDQVIKEKYKKITGHDWPQSEKQFNKVLAISAQRMTRLDDFVQESAIFTAGELEYESKILIPKQETRESTIKSLELSKVTIKNIEEKNFTETALKDKFKQIIASNSLNNKVVLWPLRVAITGLEKSPGVFEVMEVLGKDKVIKRVEKAITSLQTG
ncbi:glutamate--tRNA ligase [Patescibacteria group bacterium]|nr:glutamate--tRNA ligase [Patescibacteria group bacterium]